MVKIVDHIKRSKILLSISIAVVIGAALLVSPRLQNGVRKYSGPMGIIFGKVGEEQPHFTATHENQDYQIRRYARYVVAEVKGGSDMPIEEFHGQSFRILAKYIGVFGNPNNIPKQAMAMTAPVDVYMISSEVLPTLDVSTDKSIPYRAGVLWFSRWSTFGRKARHDFTCPFIGCEIMRWMKGSFHSRSLPAQASHH